jgi:UDP-N-acetylmuramate--alanine ligase
MHIHFIGIGGIGMSALARWFKAHNWRVSGSDIAPSTITDALRRENIRITMHHAAKNIASDTTLVITTLAIKPSNPEMQAARGRRIPVLSYPEVLGHITQTTPTVAVAGAHGKSTTTALLALMLAAAKQNPTAIIGTLLREFGGSNFRAGADNLLVLEADEYGRAFLHYSPTVAVVTNIDREHLDVYPTLRAVKNAFLAFLSRVRRGGTLVLNRDSENLRKLNPAINKIARAHKLKTSWYSAENPIARDVRRTIRIPGAHNISNAIGAVTAAHALGVSKKTALRALSRYRGAWRRMEYRGSVKFEGISVKKKRALKNAPLLTYRLPLTAMVFDDYAHHPTEIKATLAAFREKFPHSPLICVFQPHQTLRLQKLFKDFVTAFDNADALILLPVYQVTGRDRVNPRFTSESLAKAIQEKYPKKPVIYVANPKNLRNELSELIAYRLSLIAPRRRAAVVMMGAGDIVRYTESLLKA